MSGFTFSRSPTPGRWRWIHKPTGASGETSTALKERAERLVEQAAAKKRETEEQARVARETELEETRDEYYLLGFASGLEANPRRVEFSDGSFRMEFPVARPTEKPRGVDALQQWEQNLVATAEQLAAREKIVKGKEAVLAGAREPMPESLEARIREVERQEAHWKGFEHLTPERLREWEDRLNYTSQESTKLHEQLLNDRAALERTRAQLLSGGARDS